MSSKTRLPSHDLHERRVLASIETGRPISQRSLARELGIALGLTNLLLRKMARRGLVRLVRIRPNRVRYLITPAGIAEKTRMSQAYFSRNVHFYRETCDRIRATFEAISRMWPKEATGDPAPPKRIVFFGAGEVAEIGFVCLQATDLTLVGVVDPQSRPPFFGLPVAAPAELEGTTLNGTTFDRLVVMSFEDSPSVREKIDACRVSPEAVLWL